MINLFCFNYKKGQCWQDTLRSTGVLQWAQVNKTETAQSRKETNVLSSLSVKTIDLQVSRKGIGDTVTDANAIASPTYTGGDSLHEPKVHAKEKEKSGIVNTTAKGNIRRSLKKRHVKNKVFLARRH